MTNNIDLRNKMRDQHVAPPEPGAASAKDKPKLQTNEKQQTNQKKKDEPKRQEVEPAHSIYEGYQPSRPARILPAPASRTAVPRRGARLLRGTAYILLGLLGLVVVGLAGFRISAAWRETGTVETMAPKGGRFVETPGGRMHFQDQGPRDGIPVVLIHGTAAWSEFWRGTIDHLIAQKYRVIAIDLPPFGFSQRSPTAAYSRADQTKRIVGILDALKIERAILVGHSFGAGATVETVMLHPQRVRGLILVAGALGLPEAGQPPAPPSAAVMAFLDLPVLPQILIAATATNPLLTRQLLGTMVARKEAASAELADILRRPMTLRNTTPDFVHWAKAFLTPDLSARSMSPSAYRNIAAKTRLVWGDLDTLTPLPQGARLEKLIPGAKLSLMRGVGHIPQIEDPRAFRPLLTELLREVQ